MKFTPSRPHVWMRIVLQVSIALQVLGDAIWMLRYKTYGGTPLFSWLWHSPETGGLGWKESTAQSVEWACGIGLLLIAIAILVRPRWYLLFPIALFQTLLALLMWRLDEGFWPSLTLPSHALRIVTPIALALIAPPDVDETPTMLNRPTRHRWKQWITGTNTTQLAATLLRWAIALTFFAHGLEAFFLSPGMQALIAASAGQRLGWWLEQETIESLLRLIGILDMATASLLLFFRWRWLVAWMAFWGAVTALSRVVAGGWDLHLFDVLIRSTHTGAPLALGIYWTAHENTQPTELAPQNFSP